MALCAVVGTSAPTSGQSDNQLTNEAGGVLRGLFDLGATVAQMFVEELTYVPGPPLPTGDFDTDLRTLQNQYYHERRMAEYTGDLATLPFGIILTGIAAVGATDVASGGWLLPLTIPLLVGMTNTILGGAVRDAAIAEADLKLTRDLVPFLPEVGGLTIDDLDAAIHAADRRAAGESLRILNEMGVFNNLPEGLTRAAVEAAVDGAAPGECCTDLLAEMGVFDGLPLVAGAEGGPTRQGAVAAIASAQCCDEQRRALHDFSPADDFLAQLAVDLAGNPAALVTAEELLVDALLHATADELRALDRPAEGTRNFADVAAAYDAAAADIAAAFGDIADTVDAGAKSADTGDVWRTASPAEAQQMRELMARYPDPQALSMAIAYGAADGLRAGQQEALLDYAEDKAFNARIVADTGHAFEAFRDFGQILINLGVRDPDVARMVSVADNASKAMKAFAEGNYLGALVAVTSIFRRPGPNADQLRFEAIVGRLDRIQQTLDLVVDLQRRTLEALQVVSQQIVDFENRASARFDAIDDRLDNIAALLWAVSWQPYQLCNSAYSDALVPEFDPAGYRFATLDALMTYLREDVDAKARRCASALTDFLNTVRRADPLGNLLSISYLANDDARQMLTATMAQPTTEAVVAAREYRDQIYDPLYSLVSSRYQDFMGGGGEAADLPFGTAIGLLGSPSTTVTEVRRRIEAFEAARLSSNPPAACGDDGILPAPLAVFLCTDARPSAVRTPATSLSAAEAEARAVALLRNPLIPDISFLVDWAGATAIPYDLAANEGGYLTREEILAGAEASRRGFDLVSLMTALLSLEVAQQAIVTGDLASAMVYDALWDKQSGTLLQHVPESTPPYVSEILEILRPTVPDPADDQKTIPNPLYNSFLARNVLMFALTDQLLLPALGGDASIPYAEAIRPFFAVSDPDSPTAADERLMADGAWFLRALFRFPEDVSFRVEDRQVQDVKVRRLLVNLGGIEFEMPGVAEFESRSLVYPPRLHELVGLRGVMADRLVDYTLLTGLPAEQQDRIAQLLLLGLATPIED